MKAVQATATTAAGFASCGHLPFVARALTSCQQRGRMACCIQNSVAAK
jgi:hypothetical protein